MAVCLAQEPAQVVRCCYVRVWWAHRRWATAPSIHDPNTPRRTRVVVLGSGWGAASFLKGLDRRLTGGVPPPPPPADCPVSFVAHCGLKWLAIGADDAWYDVTVVSPNNFFQCVRELRCALFIVLHVADSLRMPAARVESMPEPFGTSGPAAVRCRYTPLLPGAVTGSVEMRSIIESTRHLLQGAPRPPITDSGALIILMRRTHVYE